jgi:hypothetical protein
MRGGFEAVAMILYGGASPNVKKVSIMLEEIEQPHEYRAIQLHRGLRAAQPRTQDSGAGRPRRSRAGGERQRGARAPALR